MTPDARADTAALAAAARTTTSGSTARGIRRTGSATRLILIVLVIIGTYLAWTKAIPFQSHFELHAVFKNAANIRKDSPVRIAGVNVGKVVNIKSVCDNGLTGNCASNYSDVTFTRRRQRPADPQRRPGRDPAAHLPRGQLLPRREPGQPERPLALRAATRSRSPRPPPRSSSTRSSPRSRRPDRANLQKLLEGYGTALTHKPTAADDATQDPEVQGLTAAEAINKSFTYGQTAARDSAIVNEALQGTSPHDLSNLIAGQAKIFGALNGHESQLQGLVSNFNTVTGALADESANLQRTIKLLGPTLQIAEPSLRHTNATLPFLRAFARDLTPGHPRAAGDDRGLAALAGPDRCTAPAERARLHRQPAPPGRTRDPPRRPTTGAVCSPRSA